MLSSRQGAAAMAIVSGLLALLCATALAASGRGERIQAQSAESQRQYQAGLGLYVKGDQPQALAAFRKALALDPTNVSARAAISRLSFERSAPAPLERSSPPDARSLGSALAEKIDDYLLVQTPRYLRFVRTLGDAWADQGTLAAMQGRVAQMMTERKHALGRGRAFGKEQELRALVRRLPTVLA